MMRRKITSRGIFIWIVVSAVFLIAAACWPMNVLAQATNAATNIVIGPPAPATMLDKVMGLLIANKELLWKVILSIVTPLIVGLIDRLDFIPVKWLPVIAPIISTILASITNAIGLTDLGWVDKTQVGAAGVGIREAWNQQVTKRLQAAQTTDPRQDPNLVKP